MRDIATGNVASRARSQTALTADLVGSIGLFGQLELGVHLPVHLIYDGDPYGGLVANAGVGDLRSCRRSRSSARAASISHVVLCARDADQRADRR